MRSCIAVPSKQRLASPTIRGMINDGLAFVVYCHRTEEADYRYAYPEALVITHDETDLGAIRQRILWDARKLSFDICWQVDDDVTRPKVRVPPFPGHSAVDWVAFFELMDAEFAHWPTVAVAGPRPIQWAWADEKPVLNGHSNGFVGIRCAAPVNYEAETLEDLHIVLSALSQGWHTVRWPNYAYAFPKMGTGKGGMEEAYADGKLARIRAKLLSDWGSSGLLSADGTRLIRTTLTKPERTP